jgi:hypothetical protein
MSDASLRSRLQPILDAFAAERARVQRWQDWRFGVSGVVAAVALLLAVFVLRLPPLMLVFVTVGAFGVVWTLFAVQVQSLSAKLKAPLNQAIAAELGLNYDSRGDGGVVFREALTLKVIPSHDSSHIEDVWSGTVDGQRFQIQELKLTEKRGSGKNRRTVTVFAGQLLGFDVAKRFQGTTLLARDFDFAGFLSDLQRTRFVDPRFEDAFDVFTSDPVEAHYLLDPTFAEKLVALETELHGKSLRAAFINGRLLLSFAMDNRFETGGLDADKDWERIEATVSELHAAMNLIKTLR